MDLLKVLELFRKRIKLNEATLNYQLEKSYLESRPYNEIAEARKDPDLLEAKRLYEVANSEYNAFVSQYFSECAELLNTSTDIYIELFNKYQKMGGIKPSEFNEYYNELTKMNLISVIKSDAESFLAEYNDDYEKLEDMDRNTKEYNDAYNDIHLNAVAAKNAEEILNIIRQRQNIPDDTVSLTKKY